MKKAVAWLEDTQLANGAFADTGKAEGALNANSTGLAGWALGEAGATERPAKAAVVGARPTRCRRRTRARGSWRSTSARSPTTSTRLTATAQRSGITKKTSDQWRRASAQALPVLRWAPRADGDFTVDRAADRGR